MGETWRSCISEHHGSTASILAWRKDRSSRRQSVIRHITTLPLSLAATATGSVLHTLALTDGDCGLGVGGCGTHALLDLTGHGKESLLDVGGALRRRLEKGDAEAVSELLIVLLDAVCPW
jgi:hypothetical protein